MDTLHFQAKLMLAEKSEKNAWWVGVVIAMPEM